MHGQEAERSGEAEQSLEKGCPRSDIRPSSEIEATFIGESDGTHAKNVTAGIWGHRVGSSMGHRRRPTWQTQDHASR
jgi:hypothetical protein